MPREEKARGIILRARRYSDTSLIIHWITCESGLLSTLAKGALRGKSPFYGKLDFFYEADFTLLRSTKSTLHLLKEVVPTETHPHLRASIENLSLASYAALLLEHNVEVETPIRLIFGQFREHLESLKLPGAGPAHILAFEWKFLLELGVAAREHTAGLTLGSASILHLIARNPLPAAGRLRPTLEQTREIEQFLARLAGQAEIRLPKNRARLLHPSK